MMLFLNRIFSGGGAPWLVFWWDVRCGKSAMAARTTWMSKNNKLAVACLPRLLDVYLEETFPATEICMATLI